MNDFSIGTMSGTSMDGVDVALVSTNGEDDIQLLAEHSLTYPLAFHQQLKALEKAVRDRAENLPDNILSAKALLQNQPGVDEIILQSTQFHLEAIRALLAKIKLPQDKKVIVGYHGQTLYHNPARQISLQVGLPQYLADQLECKVIADFRGHDIASGGQGAPFAPLLHRALILRDELALPCVVINCGGISNVTVISNKAIDDVMGFDTGPGNVLLDQFVRDKTHAQKRMDENGEYALQGKVSDAVLEKLFEKACRKKDFYYEAPPKSLDSGDFHLIDEAKALSIEDGCATLAAFTAKTIALNLQYLHIKPKTIILAGGGWHHPVISREFIREWPLDVNIKTADEIGWHASALEAQIFAYFAVRSQKQLPLSLPKTTGVALPLTGGVAYQPKA